CDQPEDATCGFYFGTEPEVQDCQACGMERCCDEGYARNHDPEVSQYIACLVPCAEGDAPCFYDCLAQHPDGYTKNSLFFNCLTMECADECEPMLEWNPPCGLSQDESGDAACDTCMASACCDAYGEQSSSEEYYQFISCYYGCTDSACQRDCTLQHTRGYALYQTTTACVGTNCYAECSPSYPWLNPCGNLVSTNPACNLCMQSACCEEFTNYGLSVDGMAYLLCVNNVSYTDEYAQCRVDWADGYALDALVDVCQRDHCAAECNSTPMPCGRNFEDLPACGTCVENTCCAAAHACMSDFDCTRLDLCRYINNCTLDDAACLNACRADHPDGVALYDPYIACLTGPCTTECADW
ncbi:MAG: hypothetical protein JRI23_05175, partial [Deltaproteobacteria bacterium]|nr:hypothetical protein [Deltaproteobacteria bacterium]MBW2530943.1 hypothetical protein [Deltaproteobacteria bacterium]